MNYLEIVISNYLIDSDVRDKNVIQIAEYLYVSRALVYKVLNKMGYNSFTLFKAEKNKYQKSHSERIKQLISSEGDSNNNIVDSIYSANNLFIMGFNENKTIADYFTRQLVNLGFMAINVSDSKQIYSYLKLMKTNDVLIFISNSGADLEDYNKIANCDPKKFVITTTGSLLYTHGSNSIGIQNHVSTLANVFERDSILESLDKVQSILFQVYGTKLKINL